MGSNKEVILNLRSTYFDFNLHIPSLKINQRLKFNVNQGKKLLVMEPESANLLKNKFEIIKFLRWEVDKEDIDSTVRIGKPLDFSGILFLTCPSFTIKIKFLDEFKNDIEDAKFLGTHKQIFDDFANLLLEDDFSEVVTIECKSGEELMVNKSVLVARSDVFQKMFAQDTLESKTKRVQCAFDKGVMSAVLDYMYTGNASKVKETCRDIMLAADYYQLPGLMLICKSAILEETTPKNAISTLQFINNFGEKIKDLQHYILTIISWNAKEVIEAAELLTLEEPLPNQLNQLIFGALADLMVVKKDPFNVLKVPGKE